MCDYVDTLGYLLGYERDRVWDAGARRLVARRLVARARSSDRPHTPSVQLRDPRRDRSTRPRVKEKKEIVRGAVRDRVARRASVSVSVSRVDDVKALIMVDMNEWARARGPRRTRVDRVCGRKTRVGDVGWAR